MAIPDLHGTIDCDIHVDVRSVRTLFPYLAEHWREYIYETSFKGPVDTSYPPGAETSARPELRASRIGLDDIRERALDPFNTAIGILTCAYAVDSVRNPFAAAALATAVNEWQVNDWLSQESRLRGSVVVPIQDPVLAAEEIDRVGGDSRFVQVLLPVHAEALYGNRRYYPVYEAALRHDLAIGIHFGGNPGSPPTAVGWPSYYIEEYVGMSHIFQSQVISLVTEGVFDKFPSLRVALIESGVTWLPSLMWRLDKEWKGLRREVPWVRRLPSEYIQEHIRLTTQPIDLPGDDDMLLSILEQLNAEELLMFASDFPHNHAPASPTAFLEQLPADVSRRIMRDNAASFYRLPVS
jgi:predicted TIM-barrel fold metal-dependent hydrolase